MALTKRALCTRVLRQGLAVADALQDPSAEDVAFVASVYDTKHKVWKEDGLVYWPNSDSLTVEEVPESVVDALVGLLANACGGAFGDGLKPIERMAMEEQLIVPLRRHISKRSMGESVEIEYF